MPEEMMVRGQVQHKKIMAVTAKMGLMEEKSHFQILTYVYRT